MSDTPPNSIVLAAGVWLAEADAQWSFSRSSGPGGQSVNKLSTRAELRVSVPAIQGLDAAAQHRLRGLAGQRHTADDELLITSDKHRSQIRNRADCIERLVELVGRALVKPRVRKATRPSRAAVRRGLEAKKQRGEKKGRRKPPEF